MGVGLLLHVGEREIQKMREAANADAAEFAGGAAKVAASIGCHRDNMLELDTELLEFFHAM